MQYKPGQYVRLNCDVPEAELVSGQIGIVRSHWFEPLSFYELEFPATVTDGKVEIVLDQKQFDLVEETPPSTNTNGSNPTPATRG